MNSSKTNEILNSINTSLSNDINVGITGNNSLLNDINTNTSSTNVSILSHLPQLTSINSNLTSVNNNLTTIDNVLDTTYALQLSELQQANIYLNETQSYLSDVTGMIAQNLVKLDSIISDLGDIGVSIARDPTKIFFQEPLNYNGNDYLHWTDYTSNPVLGYYRNELSKPIYITEFNFTYEEASEPDVSGDTYHSPAFDCKIGKVDNSDTFVAPSITIRNNRDQTNNMIKYDSYNPIAYCWKYDFSDAPIELGVSGRFGHYIEGDFSSTYYDSFQYGKIKGYYLE